MSRLSDLNAEASRELLGFLCLASVTLAINAASAATFKSTGTITYTNDGVFKSASALAAQAFTAGHAVLTAGQVGYFVVALDAAGAVLTVQGIGKLPDVPNGYTPIGIIKVVVDTDSFTPGTTALDAANVTTTYFNVMALPSVAP